jgi:hypothetical protein
VEIQQKEVASLASATGCGLELQSGISTTTTCGDVGTAQGRATQIIRQTEAVKEVN